MDHTIYELCLPSACDLGMCLNVADLVSSGKYSGTCVSVPPVTVLNFNDVERFCHLGVCGGSCVTRTAPHAGRGFSIHPSDKSSAHPIVTCPRRCRSSPPCWGWRGGHARACQLFLQTTHENFAKPVKIFLGIILRRHHTDRNKWHC